MVEVEVEVDVNVSMGRSTYVIACGSGRWMEVFVGRCGSRCVST